jgi:geranylgeranyl diphosphate synthase type II
LCKLSRVTEYFADCRARLDDALVRIGARAEMPATLRPVVEAALRSSGKRIRGTLTMAVGEACGCAREKLLSAAAAFEMIHTSALILDDLPSMDDAELRRGEPTLHRQFSEDLAILASVALLNQAYGVLGRSHAELSPRRWRLDLFLDRVVAAVGFDGTIGGQAVDLHSEAATLDFHTLEFIHSRKTGALFVAAAAAGAMLANASEETLRAIEAYAKNLGLAFQISDDVLDVTGTREILGKDVHQDAERLTFVKLAGLDGARQLSAELIETSLAAVAPFGKKAEHLRELALLVRDRTS